MDIEDYRTRVKKILARQRLFFAGGETRKVDFRRQQLNRLKCTIIKYGQEILDALQQDLGKSPEEGYLTEISLVQREIKLHMHHLRKWSKPVKVSTPLHLWPSKSYIVPEPFGIVLILSPWNYPFQLLINPLAGAIAAGNCVVLKPSPFSPATNAVIKRMVEEIFPPDYVCVMEGNGEQTAVILEQAFDFIFFTGSSFFGKEVMRAAAVHLTPVVLELGGKSPCIVDSGCNVELAAKRIAWGKLLNAGQTCIAPDYILVHHSIEQPLTDALIRYMTTFYGEDASLSPYYPRIITGSALERLKSYLSGEEIAFGGEVNEEERYMGPTILRGVRPESAVMQNEIFGPILPILTYVNIDEALEYINTHPKPLALYYFGKPAVGEEVLRRTSSGGACINDVILHIANHCLPFGGVGNSGMGKYHGRESFSVFSNRRAVLKSSVRLDFPFKYVPFKYFSITKKMM